MARTSTQAAARPRRSEPPPRRESAIAPPAPAGAAERSRSRSDTPPRPAKAFAPRVDGSKPVSVDKRDKPDKQDKREIILDAALDLFAERGFHGTAVPAVAERAHVGAGTIYRYFESKEALVNELYKRQKAALGEALLGGFPHEAPVREQFHHFWKRAVSFAEESPHALVFIELHHHADYLDDESRALDARVMGAARDFFSRSSKRQVTKAAPPDLLLAVVWGAFLGVLRGAWEGHYELTPAVVHQAEECCWEAIRR